MTKTFTIAQAFADEPRPQIELKPVESSQVKAIGYCEETKTLAVQFTRGTMAIYHYHDVEPETHKAFIGSDSIGVFFGQRIKSLPFKKFSSEPVAA